MIGTGCRLRAALCALVVLGVSASLAVATAPPARDGELPFRPGRVAVPCLTPMVQSLQLAEANGGQAAGSALGALRPDLPSDPDRYLDLGPGVRVLLPLPGTVAAPARLRKDLQRLSAALAETKTLLLDGYGLPAPGRLTVVLSRLETGAGGFLVPGADRGERLMILNYPTEGERLVRAGVHQYAHATAVAGASPVPAAWAEGFATWAGIRRTGTPSAVERAILEHRKDHLEEGLDTQNLELSAGNALWFLYLDEAFGPQAVRLTLEELRQNPIREALEQGVRRAAGYSLGQAFREFQIWTVLTGDRSTGRHLPFAHVLSGPRFASQAESYPALSVHADAAVASLGASQVLLAGDEAGTGGLVLRFEGELGTLWEADLLLIRHDGSMHLVPVHLGADGRGRETLPLAGMREAILLIRNLDSQHSGSQRYTWAAYREAAYPFELHGLEAQPAGRPGSGILVSWETGSEQDLIGFNILRAPEAGGPPLRINPIRVPAIGDLSSATSYQYVDGSAEPGQRYTYRLEGITADGLSSRSGTVSVSVPLP